MSDSGVPYTVWRKRSVAQMKQPIEALSQFVENKTVALSPYALQTARQEQLDRRLNLPCERLGLQVMIGESWYKL